MERKARHYEKELQERNQKRSEKLTVKSHTRKKVLQKKEKEKSVRPTQTAVGFIKRA